MLNCVLTFGSLFDYEGFRQVIGDGCPSGDVGCVIDKLLPTEGLVHNVEEALRGAFRGVDVQVEKGVYIYNPILVVERDSARAMLPIPTLLPAVGQLCVTADDYTASSAIDVCCSCSKLAGLEYGSMLLIRLDGVRDARALRKLIGIALREYNEGFREAVEGLFERIINVGGGVKIKVEPRDRPGCTIDHPGLDVIQTFIQTSVYSLLHREYRYISLSEVYRAIENVNTLVDMMLSVEAYSSQKYEIKLGTDGQKLAAVYNVVAKRFFASTATLIVNDTKLALEPFKLYVPLREYSLDCKLRRASCHEVVEKLWRAIDVLREIGRRDVFIPVIHVKIKVQTQQQTVIVKIEDTTRVYLKPVVDVVNMLGDKAFLEARRLLEEYCKRGLLPTHYQLTCKHGQLRT